MANKIIKGFERYLISEEGTITNKKTGRIITPRMGKVTLYNDDNIRKTKNVSSLVAETYIGSAPGDAKYRVVHKDNNKNNNHYSNLEYVKMGGNRSSNARKNSTTNRQSPNKIFRTRTFYKWTKSTSLIRSSEKFSDIIKTGNYIIIRKNVHKYRRGTYDFYEYDQIYVQKSDMKKISAIAKKHITDNRKVTYGDILDNIHEFLHWKEHKVLPDAKLKLATAYAKFNKKYKPARNNFLVELYKNENVSLEAREEKIASYLFDDGDFFDSSLNLYSTECILEEAKNDKKWSDNLCSIKNDFEYIEWHSLKKYQYV